jgi:hypothetical protein
MKQSTSANEWLCARSAPTKKASNSSQHAPSFATNMEKCLKRLRNADQSRFVKVIDCSLPTTLNSCLDKSCKLNLKTNAARSQSKAQATGSMWLAKMRMILTSACRISPIQAKQKSLSSILIPNQPRPFPTKICIKSLGKGRQLHPLRSTSLLTMSRTFSQSLSRVRPNETGQAN